MECQPVLLKFTIEGWNASKNAQMECTHPLQKMIYGLFNRYLQPFVNMECLPCFFSETWNTPAETLLFTARRNDGMPFFSQEQTQEHF